MHEKINGAILIISHQERILSIADRIVVIADGSVSREGSREEILPTLLNSSDRACQTLMKNIV
jgi:Fe-S cluster assembly ATP-binding protein